MHNLFTIINETDHIVRIELTNGKKYNPLSLDLIRDLTKTLKEISSQPKVKVLIISKEETGFSAGHDVD